MRTNKKSRLRSINPEWWLLLSMVVVSMFVALVPFGGPVLLFLYLVPIMISAFRFGRRHAVLTSVACVLLVVTGNFIKALSTHDNVLSSVTMEHWGSIAIWIVMILSFGWTLGWLFGDVQQTNEGVIEIMRHVVGRDNERHNYVRRLSYVSGVIAQEMKISEEGCETIRRAALLRDIAQLELSRETFKRFALMCDEDSKSGSPHVNLGEVMDLVLADKIYGSKFDRQPMAARILAVAAEYDDLTSTKKRRSALPPSVARTMIEREAGKKFDGSVVRALSRVCERGMLSHTSDGIASAV